MFRVQALARLGGLADADGKGVLYHNTCYNYSLGDVVAVAAAIITRIMYHTEDKEAAAKQRVYCLSNQSGLLLRGKCTQLFFLQLKRSNERKKVFLYQPIKANNLIINFILLNQKVDLPCKRVRALAFINQMKLMFGNGGSCSQCQADFTYEQIKEVFPAAAKNETLAKQLVDELNLIREKYDIDTCQKKAHLIAQFGSETGFNTLVEDLKSYTAENLIKTFGYFTRNPNEAKKYVGNTKAIAERVYGLRKVDKESDIVTCVGLSKKERKTKKCNDLGNKNMADGYNFIGRGLIQLTGRYHYENINKEFQKAFPNQGDLVANPELLEQPKYAVMSAMSYWINKGLNKLANDGGYENVDKITSIINKYTDSKAKRKAHYIDAYYAFKLFNCELLTDDDSTKPDTNLKIKEGLSWAESLAITEAQLRANPNTPYIVNYKQESGSEGHLRTEQTEAGKAKMDCSELVCRYLQKIE